MGLFKCKFSGYSVSFSPYSGTRIAVGAAQHFGIVGNGAVHILEAGEPFMTEIYSTLTQDNVFDICWNEGHENQVIVGSGDKTVKLFDIQNTQPLLSLQGHIGEVFGVHCNYQSTNIVASASYDKTIKAWDLFQASCICSLQEHTGIVYSSIWHPRE